MFPTLVCSRPMHWLKPRLHTGAVTLRMTTCRFHICVTAANYHCWLKKHTHICSCVCCEIKGESSAGWFYSLWQRVYGVSYPEKKLLKEYQDRIEEAKKRDHRTIGVKQELFFFHELSPGSAFFLPKGAHIHKKLVEFIRSEYRKRGYQEVRKEELVCIHVNQLRVDGWIHYSQLWNYICTRYW